MGEVFVGASFLTAFIAGLAALMAPCCLTVLLPTYLGSVFRDRTKVFLMTFVFFLGLVAVFLPLGLGFAGLSRLFTAYHSLIFTAGGLFMLLLAALLLGGKSMALPWGVHPQIKGYGLGAVFVLGVFSGIATTCCAPVLAGALALAVLPGSLLLGGLYSLTYVLGMVVPLFLLALWLDHQDFNRRFLLFRRTVKYTVGRRVVELSLANLVAGVTFLLFGSLTLFFAWSGLPMSGSRLQLSLNIYLYKLTNFIAQATGVVPGVIWVVLIVLIVGLIARTARRQWRSLR
ncbi:MAG: cytochrome c biogenesis protein CcdA [Candidatus Kerfeldbacteria bacterium]|nr:cytochrome c biogenesis protein CcdA [Candidatus Kerfeldbacteria bacterium]